MDETKPAIPTPTATTAVAGATVPATVEPPKTGIPIPPVAPVIVPSVMPAAQPATSGEKK